MVMFLLLQYKYYVGAVIVCATRCSIAVFVT